MGRGQEPDADVEGCPRPGLLAGSTRCGGECRPGMRMPGSQDIPVVETAHGPVKHRVRPVSRTSTTSTGALCGSGEASCRNAPRQRRQRPGPAGLRGLAGRRGSGRTPARRATPATGQDQRLDHDEGRVRRCAFVNSRPTASSRSRSALDPSWCLGPSWRCRAVGAGPTSPDSRRTRTGPCPRPRPLRKRLEPPGRAREPSLVRPDPRRRPRLLATFCS